MTLRCGECGGSVEVQDVSAGPEFAVERYECVGCGGTGTYTNGPAGERTSGVVERS